MKSSSMRGNWYLPTASNRSIPGTLHFRRGSGLYLRLDGGFAEDFGQSSEQQALIWGVLDRRVGGSNFVTLRDSFRTHWTIAMPGLQQERYKVHAAYFASKNLEFPLAVKTCAIRADILDEWTGAEDSWLQRLRFDSHGVPHYQEPQPPEAQVSAGHVVRLPFRLQWTSVGGGFKGSVHALFESEWTDSTSDRDAVRDTVTPAVQLLQFISGEPVSVREVQLRSIADEGPVSMLASWVGAGQPSRKVEPLFLFSDVSLHFQSMLPRWYELRAAHQAFFGEFFGFLGAPPKFAEQKLQTMLHCVALLAGTYAHSISTEDVFPRRSSAVAWLLRQLAELLLHGPLNSLPSTYLDELRDAEYSVEVGTAVSGIRLVWLAESTKWLLWVYLLRQLVPDLAVVSRIVERNDRIRHALDRLGGQA